MVSIAPMAPMHASPGIRIGLVYVPPIAPMLLSVSVPPLSSSVVRRFSRALEARAWRSRAMSLIDFCCTCLMFGTTKPVGVSTAMPMLWLATWMTSSMSLENLALISGKSVNATERALMRMGMYVSFVPSTSLCNCWRSSSTAPTSYSSLYPKCGIAVCDCIVLIMVRMKPRTFTCVSSPTGVGVVRSAAGCTLSARNSSEAGVLVVVSATALGGSMVTFSYLCMAR
mmetsp:Transcript_26181/g.62012  ORF Transcript_26181/g.62012 Transcript_26181/m.62012 type:complete len:227 (-) Transcript_26181:820-1500(-)